MTKTSGKLFHRYFKEWVKLYKIGAVREVTLEKYDMTYRQLLRLAPQLKLKDLSKSTYQQLINDYAQTHEKQTTMDFHHQIKSAIYDAYDEGLINRDPTRKVVIKGKEASKKKMKYLSQFELQCLLRELELGDSVSWDWIIYLSAKTGMRFAETLGLTPEDFDYNSQTITINKTWNYRSPSGGFQPTKNISSNRKIQVDWNTMTQFNKLTTGFDSNEPIFSKKRIHNTTINNYLKRLCLKANIPVISIHALRHTHASLLLYAGVSTASVARRLGHSNISTTQKTYLHIIQELENQDNDLILKHLSNL